MTNTVDITYTSTEVDWNSRLVEDWDRWRYCHHVTGAILNNYLAEWLSERELEHDPDLFRYMKYTLFCKQIPKLADHMRPNLGRLHSRGLCALFGGNQGQPWIWPVLRNTFLKLNVLLILDPESYAERKVRQYGWSQDLASYCMSHMTTAEIARTTRTPKRIRELT